MTRLTPDLVRASPTSPIPYRTIPRSISPSHPKAAVADGLLAQARTALPQSRDRETIERWLQFPDERVACTVIRTFRDVIGDLTVKDMRAWDYLLVRALDEACRDGMFWTPLLDTLMTECPYGSKNSAPELVPLLNGLRRWAAGQPDADGLIPLLEFRHLGVHAACLETNPTPAFISRGIERSPTLLPQLAAHTDLDADCAHCLALRATKQLLHDLALPEPATEAVNARLLSCAEALRMLDEHGHRIDSTVIDLLVADARLALATSAPSRADELISILVQLHGSVNSEQLRVAVSALSTRRRVGFTVTDLLRHPASRAFWREMADAGARGQWSDQRVLRALGAHPQAVSDPYVRDVLAASTDQHVQRTVLPFLEPHRYVSIFAEFARQGDLQIADVTAATDAQLAALTYEHWSPIMGLYPAGFVSEVLVHIPSARTHPEGRSHLLSSSRSEILAALCREDEATPDECAELLIMVANRSPACFETLLQQESLLRALSPGHLMPLLSHEVARVREMTLMALSAVSHAP